MKFLIAAILGLSAYLAQTQEYVYLLCYYNGSVCFYGNDVYEGMTPEELMEAMNDPTKDVNMVDDTQVNPEVDIKTGRVLNYNDDSDTTETTTTTTSTSTSTTTNNLTEEPEP